MNAPHDGRNPRDADLLMFVAAILAMLLALVPIFMAGHRIDALARAERAERATQHTPSGCRVLVGTVERSPSAIA